MDSAPKSHIVIIGGGAIGVSTAYYLQRAGYDVTVLEKGELASGCSYGNAGLIVPSHFGPLAAPGVIAQGMKWMFNPDSPFYIKPRVDRAFTAWLWKFRAACNPEQEAKAVPLLRALGAASMAEYRQLSALESLDFELDQRGLLMLHRDETGKAQCEKEADEAAEMGVEARVISADDVGELVGNTETSVTGGLYYPGDGHLDPARFVRALGDYLINNGVTIRTGCQVTGFETDADKAGVRRITAIKTSRGPVEADQVVLAGGVWSPGIARDLKLKLPIQAAKGYSFLIDAGEVELRSPLMLTEAKVAVTPLGDYIRFAGTLELAGLDLSINSRRVKAIRNAIPRYLPAIHLPAVEEMEIWAGLRPCTPDGLPLLGRCQAVENLVLAAGHAMLGISLAPISGKLAAQVVAGEPPSIPLDLMRVERFG